jgi:hypothetical protein
MNIMIFFFGASVNFLLAYIQRKKGECPMVNYICGGALLGAGIVKLLTT